MDLGRRYQEWGKEPTGGGSDAMQGIHNENEALARKGGMNWRNIQEVSDDEDVMVKGETQI